MIRMFSQFFPSGANYPRFIFSPPQHVSCVYLDTVGARLLLLLHCFRTVLHPPPQTHCSTRRIFQYSPTRKSGPLGTPGPPPPAPTGPERGERRSPQPRRPSSPAGSGRDATGVVSFRLIQGFWSYCLALPFGGLCSCVRYW